MQARYAAEPFVKLLPQGVVPQTHFVRGSNYNHINVFEDRIPGRAIVLSGRWRRLLLVVLFRAGRARFFGGCMSCANQ